MRATVINDVGNDRLRASRRSGLRRTRCALAVALLLVAAGCERDAVAASKQRWPVAAAGRACQFLDYDLVAAQLGVRFDTAGGAQQDDTFTCVLTKAGQTFPDLTLAMTPSPIDEVIFTATVVPSGSVEIKGLGLIAYQVGVGATQGSGAAQGGGPQVEVGWLSSKGRLMSLRFTFAMGVTGAQFDELTAKLIAFAKRIERVGPIPQPS